jgi:hypothetical protein
VKQTGCRLGQIQYSIHQLRKLVPSREVDWLISQGTMGGGPNMARCDPSHQSKPHNFNTIVTLFNIIETLFYTVYHTLLVLRHCRQLVATYNKRFLIRWLRMQGILHRTVVYVQCRGACN